VAYFPHDPEDDFGLKLNRWLGRSERAIALELPHDLQHNFVKRVTKEEAKRLKNKLVASNLTDKGERIKAYGRELSRQQRTLKKLKKDIGKARTRQRSNE